MNFSKGWIWKFEKEHNFKFYRSHGGSGDADESAVLESVTYIQSRIQSSHLNDVWNADDFGLFYKMAAITTIGSARLPGHKKQKDRLTFLACANASGTEKFSFLVIGKSEKPRCFGNEYPQSLGIYFRSNFKAWMTIEIFFEWLHLFDAYVDRTNDRKVLLIIDDASGYGTLNAITDLDNVEVLFSPSNTTLSIQPLDADVINSIKSKYKRCQIDLALGLDEV